MIICKVVIFRLLWTFGGFYNSKAPSGIALVYLYSLLKAYGYHIVPKTHI